MQVFENEKIFEKKIIDRMFSVEKVDDNTMSKYSFGWFTLVKDAKKVVFHAGQLGGFTNIMIKLPESKFSIIILTNYFRNSWQKIFKTVHDCAVETHIEYCIDKSKCQNNEL